MWSAQGFRAWQAQRPKKRSESACFLGIELAICSGVGFAALARCPWSEALPVGTSKVSIPSERLVVQVVPISISDSVFEANIASKAAVSMTCLDYYALLRLYGVWQILACLSRFTKPTSLSAFEI